MKTHWEVNYSPDDTLDNFDVGYSTAGKPVFIFNGKIKNNVNVELTWNAWTRDAFTAEARKQSRKEEGDQFLQEHR